MSQLILILHVLVAIAMVALILLQHGKGADAGAAFGSGSSNTMFGSVGSMSFLMKITSLLALVFFATSITLSYFSTHIKPQGDLFSGVSQPASLLPPVMPKKTNTAPTVSPPVTNNVPSAAPQNTPAAVIAPDTTVQKTPVQKTSVQKTPAAIVAPVQKPVDPVVPSHQSPSSYNLDSNSTGATKKTTTNEN